MADLVVNAVAKSHGQHAVLHNVELKVASGSLLAILGVSGSGKTTLLRLIAGFDRVDRGSIAIGGAVMASRDRHVPPERRRIGYVPQNGALFPHLTVAQNIGFGVPKAARREAVVRLLEQTGLSADLARRMPAQLSGGQQQRVALARALASEPRLVLLDEPFSALDPGLRAETAAAAVGILARLGSTAILVTHDRTEAFSLVAQIAILRDGRIAQIGTPEALYRRPADLDLARFLGEASILFGIADQRVVRCALGRLAVAGEGASGAVEVVIRPEQLHLDAAGDAKAVSATVAGITYFGADTSVSLKLAQGEAVVARILGQRLPRLDEAVWVRVEGPVVVFPKSCVVAAG